MFRQAYAGYGMALAAVIGDEYHDRPLIRVTAYGLASAISIARYTGRNHFLSDVLVGSALGYGMGHYVYKAHHNPNLDSTGSNNAPKKRSKLFPIITPEYSGQARFYGALFRWNL